jgi:hypothetical protein
MFILVEKNDNTVFYASNEIFATDDYIILGNFHLSKERSSYDQIEIINSDLPRHYQDGKFLYIDDKFSYKLLEQEIADKWIDIRNRRDALLQESDNLSGIIWPDLWASKTTADKTTWTTYRKALRDLPETYTNPDEVVWPLLPGTEVPPVANTTPTE